MLNQIFTTKVRQSQQFLAGKRVPTTLLSVPTQKVHLIRGEKDGYHALQIAIGSKNATPHRPQLKSLKAAGLTKKPRFTREIRLSAPADLSLGATLPLDQVVGVGDTVKATGTSKGKGFAGVMKRHGFAGQPKTHGQSDRARAPGSIGRGTTPGRVVKGKKMAGRLGGETVTIKGLKVINVDSEDGLITLAGLVPGSRTGLIRLTVTKKNPHPPTPVTEEEVVETTPEASPESPIASESSTKTQPEIQEENSQTQNQ